MGGTSILRLYSTITTAQTKWRQQHKMAAPISEIFLLNFCTTGRSGEVSLHRVTDRLYTQSLIIFNHWSSLYKVINHLYIQSVQYDPQDLNRHLYWGVSKDRWSHTLELNLCSEVKTNKTDTILFEQNLKIWSYHSNVNMFLFLCLIILRWK